MPGNVRRISRDEDEPQSVADRACDSERTAPYVVSNRRLLSRTVSRRYAGRPSNLLRRWPIRVAAALRFPTETHAQVANRVRCRSQG